VLGLSVRLFVQVDTRPTIPPRGSGSSHPRGDRDSADERDVDEWKLADQELADEKSEVGRLQRLLDERSRALWSSNEALDLRDEFLALVSHDLRNPLSAIALNTQLLERLVSSGDPRLTRISRSLASSIAQMQRIISDLLDLAAIQAGKLSVQLQPGDARRPIEEAVEASRSIAAEKSIALDAVIGPDPLSARFDPGRIEQVLENLIHNALKFTPTGGRISVEGQSAEDVVEIRVRDTGPGLQPEEIAVIFDRYQQVEKRGRKALGLGLYISRSIVESHGGRIRAESVPGEGSTFLFTLLRA
jgi:signal transduction histidine kinase